MKDQQDTPQARTGGDFLLCFYCFVLTTGVTWQCGRICERKKEEGEASSA